ncbi:hypothetical protein D3C78_1534060 [compost metagenome]
MQAARPGAESDHPGLGQAFVEQDIHPIGAGGLSAGVFKHRQVGLALAGVALLQQGRVEIVPRLYRRRQRQCGQYHHPQRFYSCSALLLHRMLLACVAATG